MPSIASGASAQRYTCRCLNVRIQAAPPPAPPPESVLDPAYAQVYVGDEGIEIEHPQLTLRARQRVASFPEINRYSRFTTLTCLLCDLPVYRVFQTVPADVEGKDGPVLPAEDWVEKEVMKSSNGWIEVHKDTLTGDSTIHAEESPAYSSLFNLVVPPVSATPPKKLERVNSTSSKESAPAPEPKAYLPDLKPLFSPPPFTPSHPAFLHLAALADKETKVRREAAEKNIQALIQQQVGEIEQQDAIIRQQVEALWRKFRESMKKVHDQQVASSTRASGTRSSRSRSRENSKSPFARNLSPSYGTPIAIRDFVPISVSVSERRPSSPPQNRQSALSASLATTSFHHPRASQGASPPPDPRGSPDSTSSKTLSTRSGSATLVQPTAPDAINVLQFRRNVDDTINTQASYRYFVNMEEDMAREKERRRQAAKANGKLSAENQQSSSSAHAATETNATKKDVTSSAEGGSKEAPNAQDPPIPSRGRDPKGKRKVTFDVEPEVATVNKEPEAEVAPAAAPADQQDSRGMIFDLEDMDSDKDDYPSPRIAPGLPLLEPAPVLRPLRPGKAKTRGLLDSFAGLRPASLPNPSLLRPLRSPPGVDVSHSTLLPSLYSSGARRGGKTNGTKSPTSEGKENNDELPGQVGADLPGHRGAWSPDGRIWQNFTRGRPVASNVILEENETDNLNSETIESNPEGSGNTSVQKGQGQVREHTRSHSTPMAGFPGSLPVHINMKMRPRESLSLASYQPQNAMPQDQAPEGTSKPMSTTAIRRAMYAERDRSRSVDPGTLDLVEEGDEDDAEEDLSGDEDGDKDKVGSLSTRGRKQALKILRTVNKMPEAGMWRSLAS